MKKNPNTVRRVNYLAPWRRAAAAVKSDVTMTSGMLLLRCFYTVPSVDEHRSSAQSPITPTRLERTALDNEALCVGFR